MVDSDLVVYCVKVIQRQLEEVGEKQRDLEERGVTIEKVLRGEAPGEPHCPNRMHVCHLMLCGLIPTAAPHMSDVNTQVYPFG